MDTYTFYNFLPFFLFQIKFSPGKKKTVHCVHVSKVQRVKRGCRMAITRFRAAVLSQRYINDVN